MSPSLGGVLSNPAPPHTHPGSCVSVWWSGSRTPNGEPGEGGLWRQGSLHRAVETVEGDVMNLLCRGRGCAVLEAFKGHHAGFSKPFHWKQSYGVKTPDRTSDKLIANPALLLPS